MFARNVITWCDSTRLAPRIGGAHARSLATSLYIGVLLAACFGGCPAAPQGPDGGNWPDAQGGGADGTGADGDLGVDPATSPQGIDPASIPGGDDSLRVIDLKVAAIQGLPLTVTLKPEDLQADPAGFGAISIALVSPPLVGTLAGPEQLGQGAVRYTYLSPVDFAGTVQFGYFAFNDEGESNVGTVEIVVYPEIRFTVDAGTGLRGAIASPDDQALALLSGSLNHSPASVIVAANARTVGGDPLPDGVYTWAFDGVEESGPMATHQQQSHLFSGGGLHAVTLSVLLSGISGPVACKTIPAGTEQAQVIIDPAIWGQIVDETGQPLPDVQVQVSQTASTVTTAADGVYVARVPYGWAGTLTASLAGYSFAPAQPSFLSVTRDIGNTDFVGTQEAPALMLVSPTADMTSSGNPGGPFSPASTVYTVENTGNQPLSWTASKTQNWVSLSNVGGTLAPGASDTVVVSINSNANGLAAGSYSDTVSFTNVTNGSGDTTRSVSLTVNAGSGACQTSTTIWQNFPITAQTGVFTARFDAVPNMDNMNGHTVFSEGPGTTYQDYAILIGFAPSGFLNARNGGSYGAQTQIPYTAGTTYHFRVEVDVPAHTYSVHVTPEGSGELTLATDFAFRSEQSAVASLDHWGLFAQSGWSHEVCNFVIASGGGMLSVSPSDGLTSSGNEGGPFSPASKQYVLTNTGDAPIDWSASKSQPWLDLSPAGGTLAVGASTTVTVSINANANGLTAGVYQDSITFTNDTNGAGNTSRPVSLTVNSTVGVLAVTPSVGLSSSGVEGGPFAPSSITYTLDNVGASAIDYSVAKSAAWLSLNGGGGPLSGSLAAGQTFQVIVSINANANGLLANTYNDSVAFANTTNGLGDTARPVSLNVRTPGSGTPTPVILASRISGMAPFAVFFEGTDSTDSQGRKIGDSNGGDGLFGNDLVEYTWDFGPGSEGDVGGRYFSGFNAAHVYETPGQYDVMLTVREEPVPGQSSSASTTLRVDAQAFAGTTYYVSAAGNDANSGTSPTTAWKTYSKALNAIRDNSVVRPGDRVLFNRGDVFNYSSGLSLRSANNVLIGAHGSGVQPLIQYQGSRGGVSDRPILGGGANLSIVDIRFNCRSSSGALANGPANAGRTLLFLRTDVDHYFGSVFYADLVFIVASTLDHAYHSNMFYSGSRLALISSAIGNVTLEHNLYGSVINRGVITGNYWHDSTKSGLRIAPNAAPGSWNVIVSNNRFERHGTNAINLKVTSPGSPYGGHNILIERNHILGSIICKRDPYSDIFIRNNIIEPPTGRALELGNGSQGGAPRGFHRLRLYNNTILSSGNTAAIVITTVDHQDIDIANNIIQLTHPSAQMLRVTAPGGASEITADHNLYSLPNHPANPSIFQIGGTAYTLPQWTSVFGQGASSFAGDPMFDPSSSTGLELLLNSPAVDSGRTLPVVYDDYSSPPVRRQPGRYDRGAFER